MVPGPVLPSESCSSPVMDRRPLFILRGFDQSPTVVVFSIGCNLRASKIPILESHSQDSDEISQRCILNIWHFKIHQVIFRWQLMLKITVLRVPFGSRFFCLHISYSYKKVFLFPHIQRELGEGVTWGLPIFFF